VKEFENLKTHTRREFEIISVDPIIESYAKNLNLLEDLSYQYICCAFFGEMDWRPLIGETISLHAFLHKNRLRYEYKLLVLTLLRRLESRGLLRPIHDENWEPTWEVIQLPSTMATIKSTIRSIQLQLVQFPECKQDAAFVNYVGKFKQKLLAHWRACACVGAGIKNTLKPSPHRQLQYIKHLTKPTFKRRKES